MVPLEACILRLGMKWKFCWRTCSRAKCCVFWDMKYFFCLSLMSEYMKGVRDVLVKFYLMTFEYVQTHSLDLYFGYLGGKSVPEVFMLKRDPWIRNCFCLRPHCQTLGSGPAAETCAEGAHCWPGHLAKVMLEVSQLWWLLGPTLLIFNWTFQGITHSTVVLGPWEDCPETKENTWGWDVKI